MAAAVNSNPGMHAVSGIDIERTFRKVLNLDGITPFQILGIKEGDHCDRLIAIVDSECRDRIQQYALLVEEAKKLDQECIQELKEPAVLVGSASGVLGGATIGLAAGAVFNALVRGFSPNIGSLAKLTCYTVPIVLGTKKGYEYGRQLAKEFIEKQHPYMSKLTAAMWEKEVLVMGSTIIKLSSEVGTKKERLRHVQVEQANLVQKEIQQLEYLLDYFCGVLKDANSLNSALINGYLN